MLKSSDIADLVRAELDRIDDKQLVAAIAPLLTPPRCEEREWDYGADGEKYLLDRSRACELEHGYRLLRSRLSTNGSMGAAVPCGPAEEHGHGFWLVHHLGACLP